MTNNKPLNVAPWLCLLLLPFIGACQKEENSAPSTPLTEAERDQKEFVRQSKQDWTPQSASPKLNILLLLDKTKVRKGENINYRLEIQNASAKPIPFKESAPSFIKDGSLCGDTGFKFYASTPAGKDVLLACRPKNLAVKVSTGIIVLPESSLDLSLQPGEFLLTRAYGPTNRFRELQTKFPFEELGKYRLKVVYASTGGLRAESNGVPLEVVP